MIEIVELLARCEETVSRIYRQFSDRYPAMKGFWTELSNDEVEHARLIRRLIGYIKIKKAFFDLNAVRIASIGVFLNYLLRQINKAETEKTPLINALSVALSIEKSMLEAKHFEYFKGYTSETKDIIHRLIIENDIRRDKVQKQWEANRMYA